MQTPTFFLTPPRRYNKPKFAPPTSPTPPTALTLLSANVDGFQDDAMIVTLTFDTTADDPLVDAAHDATQWTATLEGVAYVGASIEAGASNALQIIMPPGGTVGEAGCINYAASPSDISDESGRMLGVVSGFELSME